MVAWLLGVGILPEFPALLHPPIDLDGPEDGPESEAAAKYVEEPDNHQCRADSYKQAPMDDQKAEDAQGNDHEGPR